jgi:phage-related minor tail protein
LFFFGLTSLFIIIGVIGSMTGGAAEGNAAGGGGMLDVVYQLAYPAAVIAFAGGLFYLVIKRTRK